MEWSLCDLSVDIRSSRTSLPANQVREMRDETTRLSCFLLPQHKYGLSRDAGFLNSATVDMPATPPAGRSGRCDATVDHGARSATMLREQFRDSIASTTALMFYSFQLWSILSSVLLGILPAATAMRSPRAIVVEV